MSEEMFHRQPNRATFAGTLFLPDNLAAHEFLEHFRSRAQKSAELTLLFEVFRSGVMECLLGVKVKSKENRTICKDAQEWLLSDYDWVCGFKNLCETFGIDPEWLRRGILASVDETRCRRDVKEVVRFAHRVMTRMKVAHTHLT